MLEAIYSATEGMTNQQTVLEVVTNNLANVNTYGYKSDDLSFSDTLSALGVPEMDSTYSPDSDPVKFSTDLSQGHTQSTGNPLDLALDGDGFFVIQYDDGIRYTRSGNFSLNSSGQLVTIDGYPVLGTNGPIQIQGSRVEIDSAGQVIVDGVLIGILRLASFQDNSALIKAGHNTFTKTDASITESAADADVMQGFLESSNVNAVHEMARMIEAMRMYEAYQKSLLLISETLEQASNELGTV
jgi:flagellar basal-body rod protein FlgF